MLPLESNSKIKQKAIVLFVKSCKKRDHAKIKPKKGSLFTKMWLFKKGKEKKTRSIERASALLKDKNLLLNR